MDQARNCSQNTPYNRGMSRPSFAASCSQVLPPEVPFLPGEPAALLILGTKSCNLLGVMISHLYWGPMFYRLAGSVPVPCTETSGAHPPRRNHSVYRRWKVILNVYDLFPQGANRFMTCLGLGGAFHSAVQYHGREYAYGAHYDDSKASRHLQNREPAGERRLQAFRSCLQGIADMTPLWQLREEYEERIARSLEASCAAATPEQADLAWTWLQDLQIPFATPKMQSL